MKWRMLRRFLANDHTGVERYVVRDCDSRPNEREAAAVSHWVLSGRKFHVMRDHPAHGGPVMGGMWGAVAGLIPSMERLLRMWQERERDAYSNDQDFLREILWPLVKNDCLAHDSVYRSVFPGSIQFPTPKPKDPRFVGEVFEIKDGEDRPRAGDLPGNDPWRD